MSFPFEIVDIRFYFFNGRDRFTIEYCPSLFTWFVFNDRKDYDSVYRKKIEKPNVKDINHWEAREVLLEYLETVPAV